MKSLIKNSGCLVLGVILYLSLHSGSLWAGSDPSLIGYWPLDEGKKETAYDRSGLGNNGVIKGATWAIDEKWACLECGGQSSGGQTYYVEIGSQPIFNLTDELTISAWIKPAPDCTAGGIVSKGTSAVTYDYATGYTLYTGHTVDFGILAFIIKQEGASKFYGWYKVESDTKVIKNNEWSYVAVTYSVKDNRTILYHNGENIKSASAAGKIVYPNPTFLAIGVEPLFGYNPMKGFIREVKIYSRALSSDEIKESYQKNLYITKLNPEFKGERDKRLLRERCTAGISGKIFDPDTGKKINARVYVKGSDGRNYFPEEGFSYYMDPEHHHGYFYAFGGDFSVMVPPGEINLTICSGFEYEIKKLNIELNKSEKKELEIGLKRLIDMPALGWYDGEHHIHYGIPAGGLYDGRLRFDDACEICKGEGLNFANFGDSDSADVPNFQRTPTHKNTDRFIAYCGAEPGGIIAGHICMVGLWKDLPSDYKETPNYQPIDDTGLIDNTVAQGGIVVYTHPYAGGVDVPTDGAVARELPVHVALGKVQIWDVLCWDDGRVSEKKLTDWYRYLNLGFKLAGSGSTDSNLNLETINESHTAPGKQRTYVKLNKLSWQNVVEGYRHGKTFVTNGPLLIFTINGKDIGDTIQLSGEKEEDLKFHVESLSVYGIEKVDVIKNGQIIKTLLSKDEQIKEDFQLNVNETCWFAVRVYGKKGEIFGEFAHSSAIYVQFGDDPIEPKQEDIDYFLNWLDKYRKVIPEWCKLNNLADSQEQNEKNEWTYRFIDTAREVYSSLISSPRSFK